MLRAFVGRTALATLLAAVALAAAAPVTHAQSQPGQGPGGPILVAVTPDAPFGRYYAEILRAEGLNEFTVADAGALTPETLSAYQVVVLAGTQLTVAQTAALSGWVQSGGNLIAMRPDARLAGLLGLGTDGGDLADGYLGVDTSAGPGAGITGETMQFHGTADRWTLAGAASVATLYSSATAATPSPAVTLRSVGAAGGQAAAFAYDLARSVVYTRQGNPAWAGTERDTQTPVRSDDLFFGGAQPDWVDPAKVHIPQADEQQRLLANLIVLMNLDRAPLPRFWYLPRGLAAAVVMTGDDHGTAGTPGQFDAFEDDSPPGCSVADWTCVRATSYVYADTSIPVASAYEDQGFEVALHLDTDCANRSDAQLRSLWATQLGSFRASFPGIEAPRTNRTHCIAWSGWVNDAVVEREQGIRFDTNYYYWPPTWLPQPGQPFPRPGMFTGSGFPMRFADTDGTLVDVYQATTQITDEWGTPQRDAVGVAPHINALLTGALGSSGYYGVFTANMHTDAVNVPHPGAAAIVSAAQARGVPVVSAAQMLDWLDGRNGSSFQGVSFSGGRLRFTVAGGARGLTAMIPASAATGALTALTTGGGAPVSGSTRTIKGIDYVVFPAVPGAYVATYGTPSEEPQSFPRPPAGPPATPGSNGSSGALGSGTTGGGGATAARAKLMRHTARVSRVGTVRLQVRCPRSAGRCPVGLRLRHKGELLAKRDVTLKGGRTTKVTLRLTRAARALVARSGSLRVKAVIRHVDGERGTVATTTRITLLAPGWR